MNATSPQPPVLNPAEHPVAAGPAWPAELTVRPVPGLLRPVERTPLATRADPVVPAARPDPAFGFHEDFHPRFEDAFESDAWVLSGLND